MDSAMLKAGGVAIVVVGLSIWRLLATRWGQRRVSDAEQVLLESDEQLSPAHDSPAATRAPPPPVEPGGSASPAAVAAPVSPCAASCQPASAPESAAALPLVPGCQVTNGSTPDTTGNGLGLPQKPGGEVEALDATAQPRPTLPLPNDSNEQSQPSPFSALGALGLLSLRLPSTRSLASSGSVASSGYSGMGGRPCSPTQGQLMERAGTAPGSDGGAPVRALPASYSLTEHIPSASFASGLSSLFAGDASGTQQEQNFLSLEDDARSSSSSSSSSVGNASSAASDVGDEAPGVHAHTWRDHTVPPLTDKEPGPLRPSSQPGPSAVARPGSAGQAGGTLLDLRRSARASTSSAEQGEAAALFLPATRQSSGANLSGAASSEQPSSRGSSPRGCPASRPHSADTYRYPAAASAAAAAGGRGSEAGGDSLPLREIRPLGRQQSGSGSSGARMRTFDGKVEQASGSAATRGVRAARSTGGKRSRDSLELPSLALRLAAVSGPAATSTYTSDDATTRVTVGRLDGNSLVLRDAEVSGQHLVIEWDCHEKYWQVADNGSLNGTLLNGFSISGPQRQQGQAYRLRNNDVLQLGTTSKLKVGYVARDMLPIDLPPQHVQVPQLIVRTGSAAIAAQPKSAHSSGDTYGCATLGLEGAVQQRTGFEHVRRRQECEDVWAAECPLDAGGAAALFCLFDGHCGRAAADRAQALLPALVAARVGAQATRLAAGEGLGAVWESLFLAADDAIRTDEGCTATALLVWRDARRQLCVQAANVGDSSAISFAIDPPAVADAGPSPSAGDAAAARGPGVGCAREEGDLGGGVCCLTEDHRLTNPRERQRLLDLGIVLAKHGTRLYGLNLSRCLGDRFLKDEDLGLTAVPHVSPVLRIAPGQAAMVVLASDGLWDVAEPQRVMATAVTAHENSFGSMRAVANAICSHAQRQRTKDDVTVFALRLVNDVATATGGGLGGHSGSPRDNQGTSAWDALAGVALQQPSAEGKGRLGKKAVE